MQKKGILSQVKPNGEWEEVESEVLNMHQGGNFQHFSPSLLQKQIEFCNDLRCVVWMGVDVGDSVSVSITCYRCFSVCFFALDILFSSALYYFPACYKIPHPQALGTTWWKYSIHWFHIYHLLRLGRAAFLCQSAPTGSATFPAPSKGFRCLCPGTGLLCAAVTWGEMLWNKLCEICVEPWQGPPWRDLGEWWEPLLNSHC